MNYKGTINDLRAAGVRAALIIRQEPNVRHVVYGYKKRGNIFVFEWKPIRFYSDEGFYKYVEMAEDNKIEMIYAAHIKE